MAISQIQAAGVHLISLRKKLAARKGVPGYEKNCEALEAEIARIEGNTLRPADETTSPDNRKQDDA